LDSIDAGIIRELSGPDGSYQWNVRHSYSAIAHKLGVDEETIRRRVRCLWHLGYIRGSELVINPYLLGREPVRVLLNVGNPQLTKKGVISQIKLIDGVLLIIDTLGQGLQVILFCENEETIARRTELIAAICQSTEDPWILRNLDALGFNLCKVKLTRTRSIGLEIIEDGPTKKYSKSGERDGCVHPDR